LVIGQGSYSLNLVFKDNVVSNNEYGVNCQIAGVNCWPGKVQNNNVIIDNRSQAGQIGDGPLNGRYPSDFIAASQSSIGWIDPANGNYRLSSVRSYKD